MTESADAKSELKKRKSPIPHAGLMVKGDARQAKGGAAKSETKIHAVRQNGLMGGRPARNPDELPCTCGRGDALYAENHKSTCPRYRAWRRQRQEINSRIL